MTMQQFLTMTLSSAKSVTAARGVRRTVAGLVAAGIVLIAAATPATAAVFTVDNPSDEVGATGMTLRKALAKAEASPEDDMIVFADNVTEIHLTQGELWIGWIVPPPDFGVLMIDGHINGGQDRVRIDAGGQSGVLVAASGEAWLTGLELVNGNASLGAGFMVWDEAKVALDDSWIHDNYASQGGGIYSIGVLTINDTTVEYNISGDVGGGVYVYGGYNGSLKATNLTLSHNAARSGGGGLFNDETVVTLTNPIVRDNTARNGGGIYNYLRRLSLYDVSANNFSGNHADRKGNDIYYTAGSVTGDLTGLSVYVEQPKGGRK